MAGRSASSGQEGRHDELVFTTVVQVAQPIYPRLKPNGSTVTYRAASRGVVPVLPDLSQPECRYEEKTLRSANVVNTQRGPKQRLAYTVQGNKPGTVVVFKVDSADQLLQVSASARFTVRSPSPAGCDFHLDISTDGGKTWKPFGKADMPADNEFSSGWVYGTTDVAAANVKSALVRVHLVRGRLPDRPDPRRNVWRCTNAAAAGREVTYAWKEAGQVKTHVEKVPAGVAEHQFLVPTGANIVDEFIRIRVP